MLKLANAEYVVLTPRLIHAGKSGRGGWNKRQLAAIGIAWVQLDRPGWIRRNSGRRVTQAAYLAFLSLRGMAGRADSPDNLPEENHMDALGRDIVLNGGLDESCRLPREDGAAAF